MDHSNRTQTEVVTARFRAVITLADLIAGGDLEGMKPYHVDIDDEIAREYPCCKCGGPCTYRGFRDGRTYLAFQVCTRCGHAAEF